VTLAVTGNSFSGRVVWRHIMLFLGSSIVVDWNSMGQAVAERSWKDADLVCSSCI
jgi:hypothetical protein